MTELDDLIAALPRLQRDPRLGGVRAVFRFLLDKNGIYHLRLDEGRAEALPGDPGHAATTFRCSHEDFKSVFLGDDNLLTAVLQGRIDVEGDLEKLFVFHKLLRVRRAHRAAGQEARL